MCSLHRENRAYIRNREHVKRVPYSSGSDGLLTDPVICGTQVPCFTGMAITNLHTITIHYWSSTLLRFTQHNWSVFAI